MARRLIEYVRSSVTVDGDGHAATITEDGARRLAQELLRRVAPGLPPATLVARELARYYAIMAAAIAAHPDRAIPVEVVRLAEAFAAQARRDYGDAALPAVPLTVVDAGAGDEPADHDADCWCLRYAARDAVERLLVTPRQGQGQEQG